MFEADFRITAQVRSDGQRQRVFLVTEREASVNDAEFLSHLATIYQEEVYTTLLPGDVTIQEYFIRNTRPEGKYYDMVLPLLRMNAQGLRESNLMLTTGLSQTATRTILADLEEQRFIERNLKSRTYIAVSRLGQMDFSAYDEVRLQKLQELSNIQNYVRCDTCYMEYLTTYLGDEPGSHCRQCGGCRKTNFTPVTPARRIQGEVAQFLEEGLVYSL